MCDAFPSRGSDPHKMVARSISARLGGFESAVHTTFRRRRTLSSAITSAERLAIVEDFDGSEGYAESREEQAKMWELCSIRPTPIQIQAADSVASQTKVSKWKRFVQNVKSRVRSWGRHSRPFSQIEYLYNQSFCPKNFDDGNCPQIQWTVGNSARESVWALRSAANSSARRVPIWQRRNRSPIPAVHIPNGRPSRAATF